jgi:PncC family amidohydrolase
MEEALEIQIGTLLREKGLKLAIAESFTGGLISDRITNVAGSSDYFLAGLVTYAYEAKVGLLGVSWDTLKKYGAVSRETVLEMANGARKKVQADLAISVTGIAGPGGGLPNKPVGTAWVGLVSADGQWARLYHFHGTRLEIKSAGTEAALQMLLDYLQGRRNLEKS